MWRTPSGPCLPSSRASACARPKPIASVRTRASNLGLKQRVAWSEREYEILREAHAAGESLTAAAQRIGRPYPNVARVATNLQLDFRRQARPA